jgi:hypothetical protein
VYAVGLSGTQCPAAGFSVHTQGNSGIGLYCGLLIYRFGVRIPGGPHVFPGQRGARGDHAGSFADYRATIEQPSSTQVPATLLNTVDRWAVAFTPDTGPKRLRLPAFRNDPAQPSPASAGCRQCPRSSPSPSPACSRSIPATPGSFERRPARTRQPRDSAAPIARSACSRSGRDTYRVQHRHLVPPPNDPHLIGGARAGPRSNRGFPTVQEAHSAAVMR